MTEIKIIEFSQNIVDLRQKVLHPGGPVSRVTYDTDSHPESIHLGIYEDSKLIACGSLLPEDDEAKISQIKNRVRGMAVDEVYRRKGLGGLILDKMLEITLEKNIKYTWCNARTHVLSFYERRGFVKTGEVFDVPGSGPHYKMIRKT